MQTTLSPEYVHTLHRRIRNSSSALRAQAEIAIEAAPSRWPPRNLWLDATAFLDAFTRIDAPPGYRLACVFEATLNDRQSRLVLVESVRDLPEIPDPLAKLEFGFGFGEPSSRRPDDLPSWI